MWHLKQWPFRNGEKINGMSAADELLMFDLLSINDGPFALYWQALAKQRDEIELALSAAMMVEEHHGYESIFSFDEVWRAARIICDFRYDVLPVPKTKSGKRVLVEVLEDLNELISATQISWPPDVKMPRQRLPDLANYRIAHALGATSQSKALMLLQEYKDQIEHSVTQHRPRENRRAYAVALALRAVFEHYTEFPIAVAQTRDDDPQLVFPKYEVSTARYDVTGEPKAPYMRALAGIYSALRIEATLHHYAAKARGTPDDDIQLSRYKLTLKGNITNQSRSPLILTEFGWVANEFGLGNNLQASAGHRELYANFYTYREVKAWQRKCSKANASMMTRIRNWI